MKEKKNNTPEKQPSSHVVVSLPIQKNVHSYRRPERNEMNKYLQSFLNVHPELIQSMSYPTTNTLLSTTVSTTTSTTSYPYVSNHPHAAGYHYSACPGPLEYQESYPLPTYQPCYPYAYPPQYYQPYTHHPYAQNTYVAPRDYPTQGHYSPPPAQPQSTPALHTEDGNIPILLIEDLSVLDDNHPSSISQAPQGNHGSINSSNASMINPVSTSSSLWSNKQSTAALIATKYPNLDEFKKEIYGSELYMTYKPTPNQATPYDIQNLVRKLLLFNGFRIMTDSIITKIDKIYIKADAFGALKKPINPKTTPRV